MSYFPVPSQKTRLYFDVHFTTSQDTWYFPCTWATTASGTTVLERNGNLLPALPALTGGASSAAKYSQDVAAWFNVVQMITSIVTPPLFKLDFVGRDLATQVPFLKPGGGTVAQKAGNTPMFTTHFAARLAFNAAGLMTIHGVVYVQRKHAIEV
jgi:hypothetical protein